MLIQFTVQDLLLFLGCVLVGVIGVLLIIILLKANKVMGICKTLIETNKDSITRTIQAVPVIMENSEQITSNMKITTDQLSKSGPLILKDAEYITHTAKEGVEIASSAIINVSTGVNDTVDAIKQEASELSTYFHIASEIIKIIVRAFSSGK